MTNRIYETNFRFSCKKCWLHTGRYILSNYLMVFTRFRWKLTTKGHMHLGDWACDFGAVKKQFNVYEVQL